MLVNIQRNIVFYCIYLRNTQFFNNCLIISEIFVFITHFKCNAMQLFIVPQCFHEMCKY